MLSLQLLKACILEGINFGIHEGCANLHMSNRWDTGSLVFVRERDNPLVMGVVDTSFNVIDTKEELHGFFTIYSNVVQDTRVDCYRSTFTIDENLDNILLFCNCHLSLILFYRSLRKVGNMPHLLIHHGLLNCDHTMDIVFSW